MRIAEREERDGILEYLKEDMANGIYLYIDILKYGLNARKMSVWVEVEEGRYQLVVMKYYNSMQVYTLEDTWDIEACDMLIEQENPLMVSGKLSVIQRLYGYENIVNLYEQSEGYIYHFKKYKKFQYDGKIESAGKEDLGECARLICMDDGFSANYTVSDLTKQLEDRLENGMGRNYIIREEGKIIAHIATYAEEDKLAVTSGLMVHPQYRHFPYGTIMESYLINRLLEEGYKVFTFVTDKKRTKLLKVMGGEFCGQYGKLNRKR